MAMHFLMRSLGSSGRVASIGASCRFLTGNSMDFEEEPLELSQLSSRHFTPIKTRARSVTWAAQGVRQGVSIGTRC
jgi:hypothetical protein